MHRQLDRHPLATRVLLVHFVNSGAEATETALKLARAHGRNRLVTTRNGFHGKTLGALSLTSNRSTRTRSRRRCRRRPRSATATWRS
ncbi:MAG TPA: aminotransferase class III-fold pyridoxal phosphate-dependent enzyme [Micromonosporaceae bacterium]|nr:aminotransferase class III-fold pyridoxal phosphate-dependent enzyme [Micromonosporaceae bacterium]